MAIRFKIITHICCKTSNHALHQNGVVSASERKTHVGLVQDKQALMMQRVSHLLTGNRSPGNQFNDPSNSDIKLTLSSKDGFSVSMNVHRQILVAYSRFFAVKLSERWVKQQRTAPSSSPPYNVEIADCDDIEVYIEALRLMYCKDLRRRLMKENVPKVLGILKVSAAIGFDAGVLSCLEYLEAAPWAEDEEEKETSEYFEHALLTILQCTELGRLQKLQTLDHSSNLVNGEIPFMEVDFEGLVATLGGLVGRAQVVSMIPSSATAGSATDAQRLCSLAVQRVCVGCAVAVLCDCAQWQCNGCALWQCNGCAWWLCLMAVANSNGKELP